MSKVDLQTRIEILLRFRRTTHELKIRNEDLEAFVQAMSHDLRASVRAVVMFTEALISSQADRLDSTGRSDLTDGMIGFQSEGAEVFFKTMELRQVLHPAAGASAGRSMHFKHADN